MTMTSLKLQNFIMSTGKLGFGNLSIKNKSVFLSDLYEPVYNSILAQLVFALLQNDRKTWVTHNNLIFVFFSYHILVQRTIIKEDRHYVIKESSFTIYLG